MTEEEFLAKITQLELDLDKAEKDLAAAKLHIAKLEKVGTDFRKTIVMLSARAPYEVAKFAKTVLKSMEGKL